MLIPTILVLATFFHNAYQQHQRTIYDRVMEEQQFSGYRTMIKNNRIITLDLFYGGVTFFVPENTALEAYDGSVTEDHIVLYHVGTETNTLRDLRMNGSAKISTAHANNPPLWVSVVENGYYINNARIVQWKSDYVAKCKRNHSLKQVLHVIDQVLDPMLQIPFSQPAALDFLRNYQHWKLGGRKVSNFLKRVKFHEKEDLFQRSGGHTFFIPVDDKRYDHRLEDIDRYIIEGHVVPNAVLFTRPAEKNFVYETACNGDYIYMVLSILSQNDKVYVNSYTVLGDSEHQKGEVLAEIVKANIPVTNGVVHLISKPLAVFDRTLRPFPYLSVLYKITADPDLNITYHISKKGGVNKILQRNRGSFTYFAPKDIAWNDYLGYADDEMMDVISRHLVVSTGRYTMWKLAASTSKSNGTTLETIAGSLQLKVFHINGTYFIVYGQKWIRVARPDYECSDGIVHVIDGVFAAPKPLPLTAHPQRQQSGFWRVLKNMVT